jgi:hypothetical protein
MEGPPRVKRNINSRKKVGAEIKSLEGIAACSAYPISIARAYYIFSKIN